MRERAFAVNLFLCVMVALACLTAVATRDFLPAVILPQLNLPLLALLSLAALTAECYLAPQVRHSLAQWLVCGLLAAAAFGLLPWCAGLLAGALALKTALLGGGVFLVCGLLFASIRERLATGAAGRAAPALCAGILYLASQCLSGILL